MNIKLIQMKLERKQMRERETKNRQRETNQ